MFSAWGESNRVVHVETCLPPWIKVDFLPRVIGVQRRDHPFDRVIEEHGTDADLCVKLEMMSIGEERLILADRLGLVIEDSPAASDPARADFVGGHLRLAVWADDHFSAAIARGYRTRLGLNLLLDLAPKPVRVGKAVLNFGLLARLQIGIMG